MDESAEKTEIDFRKIHRDSRFVTVRSSQNHLLRGFSQRVILFSLLYFFRFISLCLSKVGIGACSQLVRKGTKNCWKAKTKQHGRDWYTEMHQICCSGQQRTKVRTQSSESRNLENKSVLQNTE